MLEQIDRPADLAHLRLLLDEFPVVAVLGARQVGKTWLAHQLAERRSDPHSFFDLEDPRDLARLSDPMLALRDLRGLVVLDEVQRRPEIFPALRVLADRRPCPAQFLVLGSASPELLRQSSESLAGRVAFHHLGGLTLDAVGEGSLRRLWLRGGFPRSFLARDDRASSRWRQQFARSYLERDVPQLGFQMAADTLRRFWQMLAHYHAQVWNGMELARAFGVTDKTVRHYLDILIATFMVRRLSPWHENISKRQVKSPKVYFSDTGLLHTLLGVVDEEDLRGHPKVGASFEGFVINEVIRRLRCEAEEAYFWGLHSGAELDLLIVRGKQRLGFEVKFTQSPALTPSMRSAVECLHLDRLDVIHAGEHTYPLAQGVRALALSHLQSELQPLGP